MRGLLTVSLDTRLGSCTINDADGVTVARCMSVLDADELAAAFNALCQVTADTVRPLRGLSVEDAQALGFECAAPGFDGEPESGPSSARELEGPEVAAEDRAGGPIGGGRDPRHSGSRARALLSLGRRKWGD